MTPPPEPLTVRPLRVSDADAMTTALADPMLHEFTGGEPASAAELRGLGVRELVAHIRPEHVASRRIAERLGLRQTGEMVDGEVRSAGLTS